MGRFIVSALGMWFLEVALDWMGYWKDFVFWRLTGQELPFDRAIHEYRYVLGTVGHVRVRVQTVCSWRDSVSGMRGSTNARTKEILGSSVCVFQAAPFLDFIIDFYWALHFSLLSSLPFPSFSTLSQGPDAPNLLRRACLFLFPMYIRSIYVSLRVLIVV